MIDMTNKTVYLSGGITGVQDYRVAFDKAEAACKELGARVIINPAELPSGWDWGHYMAACVALVQVSDAVIMLPGWKTSRGAVMEHGQAVILRIPCYEMAEIMQCQNT